MKKLQEEILRNIIPDYRMLPDDCTYIRSGYDLINDLTKIFFIKDGKKYTIDITSEDRQAIYNWDFTKMSKIMEVAKEYAVKSAFDD